MSISRNFKNRLVREPLRLGISLTFDQTDAWQTTHAILESPDATSESKLFAATTLKGKVRKFSVRIYASLSY